MRHEMDSGPIIAQAAISVETGDTAETHAARVLKAEHKLYPLALRLVASGAARVEGEVVHIRDKGGEQPALLSPPVAD